MQDQLDDIRNNLKDLGSNTDKRFDSMKSDTDKRFEKVDRRFEQVLEAIDRLGDKLENRDEKQRSFTLRMFSIAISISILGVFGVFLKSFGFV